MDNALISHPSTRFCYHLNLYSDSFSGMDYFLLVDLITYHLDSLHILQQHDYILIFNGTQRSHGQRARPSEAKSGLIDIRNSRLIGLGLGLQGLYSATNCADNILGRFTIILQNQIARVDSFTNLTKRWVFRFRLNASISSHNLISFGKQFHARGPYTANARLPKVSCLNFGTFRTRSSLDLMEYLLLFDGVIISWM